MKFLIMYEVPPMRGIYSTTINADSAKDAEEKIRSNPETTNYRIKKVTEFAEGLTHYFD